METEFLRYKETPDAKHLGVANIRLHNVGSIDIKVKLVPRKNGEGYFISQPSYFEDGKWIPWYSLDSTQDFEKVIACAKTSVSKDGKDCALNDAGCENKGSDDSTCSEERNGDREPENGENFESLPF